MLALKKYETEVLRLLVSQVLPAGQLDALIREGEQVSYEYTGSGYFLTLKHTNLPKARLVCSRPTVMGHADGIDCGFVVFIENGKLVLECHTWGAIAVPEGFREKNVQLTQANI